MGGKILNFSILPFEGQEGLVTLLPTDDVPAEHMRELPQGPLGPPAPRGPRVEPRGARAGRNRARRVAQAVPGGEAHQTKMSDVHAERAPWVCGVHGDLGGALGVHVAHFRPMCLTARNSLRHPKSPIMSRTGPTRFDARSSRGGRPERTLGEHPHVLGARIISRSGVVGCL